MKCRYFLLGSCFVLMMQGCGGAFLVNRNGIALFDIHKEALTATSNSGNSKAGQACSHNILGIITLGDSSIAAAREAGRISKIATVDTDNVGILGIYNKVCTIVVGE